MPIHKDCVGISVLLEVSVDCSWGSNRLCAFQSLPPNNARDTVGLNTPRLLPTPEPVTLHLFEMVPLCQDGRFTGIQLMPPYQGLENRCEQADLSAPGHLRPCRKDGCMRSIRETRGLGKRDKQEKKQDRKVHMKP